ncbi:MAG TPA: calcium/proton exchanger [Terriglobales bacterium]|nr:calcium/proton exchanger [Terriglobales bacterium]
MGKRSHPAKTENNPLRQAWQHFPLRSQHLWLNLLLLAIPVAIYLHATNAAPVWVFVAAALAIIPLAGVLGEATESLAVYSGPTLGGLLNATMGNATELIIAFFALRSGHIEVVKASLAGSIIGNILLVLGLSILVGGFNRQKQVFSRTAAGANSTMLFVAVVALVMPAVYDLSVHGDLKDHGPTLQNLSLWTAGVLMVVYALSFVFVLKTHKSLFTVQESDEDDATHGRLLSKKAALLALVLATIAIAFMSEMLVGEIEAVTKSFGMTELFVGVIVVAIVGNAAEHSTAIMVARQNKMDLAMTIAVGSSTQIALFVAPLLVFLSMAVGHPMSLVFNAFEISAIIVSVIIVEMISSDGETNWFEGVQLLAVYALLAVAFYFVPGP